VLIALLCGDCGEDMAFMLGNLNVEEMQRRSGVEFPSELVKYMTPRHQDRAERIEAGKWHCFDLPFVLVCGDIDTAKEVFRHLSPLSAQFAQKMQISVQST
jgi:hypothetical protein